jgi:hypothetical protein
MGTLDVPAAVVSVEILQSDMANPSLEEYRNRLIGLANLGHADCEQRRPQAHERQKKAPREQGLDRGQIGALGLGGKN